MWWEGGKGLDARGVRLGYMDAGMTWRRKGFAYIYMYDKASDKQDSYDAHHQLQSKTATTHIIRYKSKTTTKLQMQIIYYLGGEKVYIILSPHAHLARIESDN